MSSYLIYSLNTPTIDPQVNKRLGYRTPRSVLLPPYLATNSYFTEYADAIDDVFSTTVDEPTEVLDSLRNMWPTDPYVETNYIYAEPSDYINEGTTPVVPMIPFEAMPQYERPILVKQVNALGLKLQSAGLITNDQYQVISRWVGQYWFGKGTTSFINFINYCLSSSLTVQRLWTSDYVNFLPDGDPGIGTPLWDGGTWYPTSHVTITAQGGLAGIDPQSLITFFYEIANYNLVLQALVLSFDLWFTADPNLVDKYAEIVAIGLWADNAIVISNFAQYGAAPPPVYNTEPQLTASAYVTPSGMTGAFLLSAPTSWFLQNGRKYPVYSTTDQTETTAGSLPSTIMGGPSTNGQTDGFAILYGPVNWQTVPGSTIGNAKMPSYTAIPVLKTVNLNEIPLGIVGQQRENLLVNPDGWDNTISGNGQYVPYWNAND
jgi:hypothetical protein